MALRQATEMKKILMRNWTKKQRYKTKLGKLKTHKY